MFKHQSTFSSIDFLINQFSYQSTPSFIILMAPSKWGQNNSKGAEKEFSDNVYANYSLGSSRRPVRWKHSGWLDHQGTQVSFSWGTFLDSTGDGRWGQKVYLVNMIGYLVFGDYGTYVSRFTRKSIIWVYQVHTSQVNRILASHCTSNTWSIPTGYFKELKQIFRFDPISRRQSSCFQLCSDCRRASHQVQPNPIPT